METKVGTVAPAIHGDGRLGRLQSIDGRGEVHEVTKPEVRFNYHLWTVPNTSFRRLFPPVQHYPVEAEGSTYNGIKGR